MPKNKFNQLLRINAATDIYHITGAYTQPYLLNVSNKLVSPCNSNSRK